MTTTPCITNPACYQQVIAAINNKSQPYILGWKFSFVDGKLVVKPKFV